MLFYLRLFLRAIRAFVICLIYLPRLLFSYMLYGFDVTKDHKKQARSMVRMFKKLGPAYVKIGQFLATRPDLIGVYFANALGELQDKMPSFNRQHAIEILKKQWQGKGQEMIETLSSPLAAASIAQVHQAVLIDEKGQKKYVAIKILRPHLEKNFLTDVYVFKMIAWFVEFTMPSKRRLKPVAIAQTLIKSVRLEMDLRFEAAAMQEMQEHQTQKADGEFYIPKVYWPYVAYNILVSDWIDGMAFTDMQAIKASGYDCQKIAKNFLQSFLKSVVENGFFHADMHQGNVFILPNGKIALVDFGITGRLDKLWRRYYAEIIYSFIVGDYQRGARVHFEAGYVPPDQDPYVFAQALRSIAAPIQGVPSKDISIAKLLLQLLEITDLFDMQTQEKLIMLQKNMIIVEGLCRQLDPHIDIWQTSQPVMEKAIRDKMSVCGITEAVFEDVQWNYLPLLRKIPDYMNTMIEQQEKLSHRNNGSSLKLALLFSGFFILGFCVSLYGIFLLMFS